MLWIDAPVAGSGTRLDSAGIIVDKAPLAQRMQDTMLFPMLKPIGLMSLVFSLFVSVPAATEVFAAEHRVEPAPDPLPQDSLSPEIAKAVQEQGIQVIRGAKTVLCQIWLSKEWSVVDNFKPTAEVNYPFKPGELVGVVKFLRKGSDFRDQDISPGVYTMRYAQQPVDGAHVGTSLTRDFFLLIEAEKDKAPVELEAKDLNKRSAEAAGSNHPALLSLQKVADADSESKIRHVEEHDWWIVRLTGKVTGSKDSLPVDLVIAGTAPE